MGQLGLEQQGGGESVDRVALCLTRAFALSGFTTHATGRARKVGAKSFLSPLGECTTPQERH